MPFIVHKFLSMITAALTFSLAIPATAETQDLNEQTAKIQTLIQSITALVDLREFDLLVRFYDEEIVADYSSLWGTEPRKLSRTEIGSAWAGFIPGFDTTRHEISNIQASIDGDRASASANITASHWLDGETWIIHGLYTFELVKVSDEWLINSWKFILKSETGNRSLVDIAEERANKLRGTTN